MTTRTITASDFGYSLAMLLTVAGLLACGMDNSRQLARCEATGQHPETCRLLVLGR